MTRSTALESYMYGNPEAVYEANQARAKRQAQSAEQVTKRPILTLRRKSSEWSEARKRAEELFHPAAPCSVE